MRKTDWEVSVCPITRQWRPNLAFQYTTTSEHKRSIHRFHKFKNFKDRVGLPVQYYADPLAADEINHLRRHLRNALRFGLEIDWDKK